VIGYRSCMLQRAPILQIRRDSGGAKCVTAGAVGQAGGFSPALDHVQHIEPGYCPFAEPVALAHVAKERPLPVAAYPSRADPGVEVFVQTRVAGHFGRLPPFSCKSQPPALAVLEVVANLHGDRGADPG
jgi:hypothetical protein